MANFKAINLLLLALIWPLLMAGLAWLSPGSGAAPVIERRPRNFSSRLQTPPLATKPSSTFIGTEEAEGSASIFWEEPQRVRVQMVIEIPAAESKAAAEPDAAVNEAQDNSKQPGD